MSALIELAERCEAAPADMQRKLVRAAFLLCHPVPKREDEPEWAGPDTLLQPLYHRWRRRKRFFDEMLEADAYESAALMLVPEGYKWAVTSRNSACCHAQHVSPLDWVFATTPALRAQASMEVE